MKKQILSVLLAVSVLSTNLFAVSVEQQKKSMKRKLYSAVEQVESDTEYDLEADDEINDSEDADVGDVAASQEVTATNEGSCQSKPQSDIVQDMQMHVQNMYAADDWEAKRAELDKYVRESYWITGKLISEGDKQLAIALRLSKRWTNRLAEWFLDLDTIHKTHNLNVLYVKIQRNAFNLLYITRDDYFKLIQEYPEVGYLFEDLYTFFKWRAHLRKSYIGHEHNEYQYNEYLFFKTFMKPIQRNSFETWWELAEKIAKQEMKEVLNNTQNMETAANDKNICLSSKNARQERAAMNQYIPNANNALQSARRWNAIQRFYALLHGGALPCNLHPQYGIGTPQMRKEIKNQLKNKSKNQKKEEIEQIFMDFRSKYIESRMPKDLEWKKFYEDKNLGDYRCVFPGGEELEIQKGVINPIIDDTSFLDEVAEFLMSLSEKRSQ